jgi:UDP-glucose 4-epimerase
LADDPTRLRILGDGSQSKSYVHVSDIVAAVLTALREETAPYQVYNVATLDYVTVSEIAEMAVQVAGLPAGSVAYEFTGGDRGWKGDVPVVRLNSDRIRSLGWANRLTAAEALRTSLQELGHDLDRASAV